MNAIDIFRARTAFGMAMSEDIKWQVIKAYRNDLLTQSDWTQLPDAALTSTEQTAWQNYRQSLRDIPQNYAIPDEVIFPEIPT
jgi:hypothetical protein